MTVLEVIGLVAVAVGGTAVVLTGEALRQTMVLGMYGIALTFLFFVFQAPDVALSEIVVTGIGLPLIILAALRKIRQQEHRRTSTGERMNDPPVSPGPVRAGWTGPGGRPRDRLHRAAGVRRLARLYGNRQPAGARAPARHGHGHRPELRPAGVRHAGRGVHPVRLGGRRGPAAAPTARRATRTSSQTAGIEEHRFAGASDGLRLLSLRPDSAAGPLGVYVVLTGR